jgi:predicted PurR-regulated permease PerM
MQDDRSAGPTGDTATPEPQRVHLHMPIDVCSAALAVLALLASVYMLRWASAVFIPLLLGVMLSYVLSPAVARLQHWHIPRALGAAVILVAVLGGLGSMVYSLGDEAAALVESLPDAQKVRQSLRGARGTPEGPLEKLQRAGAKLEQAAEENRGLRTCT